MPDGVGGPARERLEAALAGAVPAGDGVAVQQAALALDAAALAPALAGELGTLRSDWATIAARAAAATAPARVDDGPGPESRVLGMHAGDAIGAIICNDAAVAAAAGRWAERFAPALAARIETAPAGAALFDDYEVEAAIAEALAPRRPLDGGPELVFEPGETLTAIDINAASHIGRAGSAARDANMAAMAEIARQLTLRALGGAIVIDALKMSRRDDQRAVVTALRAATADDPAGCQVLGLSALGLVEMTRARRQPTLAQRLLGPAPGPGPRPRRRRLRCAPPAAARGRGAAGRRLAARRGARRRRRTRQPAGAGARRRGPQARRPGGARGARRLAGRPRRHHVRLAHARLARMSPADSTPARAAAAACPICGKPASARRRPFCSLRCADVDLGRWFAGGYHIPTSETPAAEGGERPDDDPD